MNCLFHVPEGDGYRQVLDEDQAGLKWLAFGMLRLPTGGVWHMDTGDQEMALVTMAGQCAVEVEAYHSESWACVGERSNVFGGMPHVVYAPRRSSAQVTALCPLEVAVVEAPCDVDLPAKLLRPEDGRELSVGAGSWHRNVRMFLPPSSPVSQRLILGETLHTPGQWSGWPPHKHDSLGDSEYPLEEFYYYRMKPDNGFGVQLIYQVGGRHDAVVVSDNDVTVFHEGYHPYVGNPGSSSYYFWALAGHEKVYRVTTDSRWSWATEVEAMFAERKR